MPSWWPRGRFDATVEPERFVEADAIVICVPTPLTRGARAGPVLHPAAPAKPSARTCARASSSSWRARPIPARPRMSSSRSWRRADSRPARDFFLAYSPEREDPGNREFATRNIPKVVGGMDATSRELAVALYEPVVDGVVPVSSTRVAEACKILENTYRAVNIALVNELKAVFEAMGIDIWEVIAAAKTKPFGFQAFYPGPGLGGHCIPIDPFYLTWAARKHGLNTRFIELAGEINTAMPQYVVDRVAEALNEAGQADQGQPRVRPGRGLQEGRGRSPRIAGIRDPGDAAAARGGRILQRSAHPRSAADALTHHPPGQPAADGRISRLPGLRGRRHRPLGLRFRLDRRTLSPDRRHEKRHTQLSRGNLSDLEGLGRLRRTAAAPSANGEWLRFQVHLASGSAHSPVSCQIS